MSNGKRAAAPPPEEPMLQPEVEVGLGDCRFQLWEGDTPEMATDKWCTVHEASAEINELRCAEEIAARRADPERRSRSRRDRAVPEDSILTAALSERDYLQAELNLIRQRVVAEFTGRYMPTSARVIMLLHPKAPDIREAMLKAQGRTS